MTQKFFFLKSQKWKHLKYTFYVISSTEEKLSAFIGPFIEYLGLQTFFQAVNHGGYTKMTFEHILIDPVTQKENLASNETRS